jgi:hypothetical protein
MGDTCISGDDAFLLRALESGVSKILIYFVVIYLFVVYLMTLLSNSDYKASNKRMIHK